jgi:hypothetical protein
MSSQMPVVDIPKVMLDALFHALDGRSLAAEAVDLSPSGKLKPGQLNFSLGMAPSNEKPETVVGKSPYWLRSRQ